MPSGKPLRTTAASQRLLELGVPLSPSKLKKLRLISADTKSDRGPRWWRRPNGAVIYFAEDLESYAATWHASLREREHQAQPAHLVKNAA